MVESSIMQDTQEREILNSAANLFKQYGLKKTTMEDIATSAGMGKSSLYYYFKSKESVYEVVLREEYAEFKFRVKSAIDMTSSSEQVIISFIKEVYSAIFDFPNLINALLESSYQKASVIAKAISAEFEQWQLDRIEEMMRHGLNQGDFRAMEESELLINCQAIGIAMFGVRTILINEKDPQAFDQKIDSLIYLLLHGITNPKTD